MRSSIGLIFSRSGVLALVSGWALFPAWAQDAAAPDEPAGPKLHYALGAIASNGPDYAGGDGRKSSLRPAWEG